MHTAAVGTIVAKNFVPFARVLARSFKEHHPTVPFFAVIADKIDASFATGSEPFATVCLEELGIPNLHRLCFAYTRQQLSIAAKPYLLRYLLNKGFTPAVFLDADILVIDSLEPLFDETAPRAIALTPHLLAPLAGVDRIARELNILQSGVFNGGFIGVTNCESAWRFLDWWADRLHTHCRHDVPHGMHFDQRWLDLVPALFEHVHIVRDLGCNVAYWNVVERDPLQCRFFHFSGFEPERPASVTRYSCRLTMETIGGSEALFARYVDLLRASGYFECKDWPYAFGTFDNGVPIPDVARMLYQAQGAQAAQFGDPFRVAESHSYFRWLNEPVPAGDSTGTVTRLWDAVYRSRLDVRRAFPDVFGEHNHAFKEWTATSGMREHDIAAAFAP